MGARERVLALIDGAWTTQAIAAGCELGIFDALAAQPRDAIAVASALHADADSIERLAKALCALGLCRRSAAGVFSLTEEGECLHAEAQGSLHGWARMAGTRIWANWASLAACVRAGQSAREMRGHADFSELDGDSEAARVFNAAMVDLTRPVAVAAATVLDWSGVGTVVDVGGGSGALAVALLARHSAMRAIVSDLEHARRSAEELIAAHSLAPRCRFEAADFFMAVPQGGNAYLLKSVLHNWPDARAVGILEACRRAMAPGARIVILERIEPAVPGSDSVSREVARSDLNMLVGCGGRERSEGEFRALLLSCGFAPSRLVPLANGFHALEAVAA